MGNVDVRSTKTVPTTVQGVGQRSPVVTTRAGHEDEIAISAAVSVAAADLLGIHSNDARVAGKRKEVDAVNVAD